MDVQLLKDKILEEDKIDDILTKIGCHHIKHNNGYITCGNPDGDNKNAISVYTDSNNLTVVDYTRDLVGGQKRTTDILDLVSYFKNLTFAETIKYLCDICCFDYYQHIEEVPESLQILRMINSMSSDIEEVNESQVQPISEQILNYYLPYGNKMFEDDGISLEVQKEFQIGYDTYTNRVTIPIRNSIGDLCAVKGRIFGEPDEYHPKYLYIERNAKSKLLYGLYENRNYIKQSLIIYIFEAEKSVLQAASHDVRNCVAISGKSISNKQAEYIVRTNCIPIIALDKGIGEEEIINVASVFPDCVPVYYILDRDNILEDKQSPTDNWDKWKKLIKNNVYKIGIQK